MGIALGRKQTIEIWGVVRGLGEVAYVGWSGGGLGRLVGRGLCSGLWSFCRFAGFGGGEGGLVLGGRFVVGRGGGLAGWEVLVRASEVLGWWWWWRGGGGGGFVGLWGWV